jgi:hypothetical protein
MPITGSFQSRLAFSVRLEYEEDEAHECGAVPEVWRKELVGRVHGVGRFADHLNAKPGLAECVGHGVQRSMPHGEHCVLTVERVLLAVLLDGEVVLGR